MSVGTPNLPGGGEALCRPKTSRPDPMHFEVAKPLPEMIRIGKSLKAQRG